MLISDGRVLVGPVLRPLLKVGMRSVGSSPAILTCDRFFVVLRVGPQVRGGYVESSILLSGEATYNAEMGTSASE